MLTAALPPAGAGAQIAPEVRDRAVHAVVQIALAYTVTEDGRTASSLLPVGSGTMVAPWGLVLTNRHVIDMTAHAARFAEWEAQARADGSAIALALDPSHVVILGTTGQGLPLPLYQARITGEDARLDLATLHVVADAAGTPVTVQGLAVPYLPLGDSAALQLGDPIDLFGYPSAGGGTLTYTTGVVSGLNVEAGLSGPAWITTDATMAGGSSGGAAIDRAGYLVGVPTQGSSLDCRPGDTNGDGRVDEQDIGCIPTGGSIGQIRPINLATDLLVRAGLTDSGAAVPTPTPMSAPTPAPTATPAPTPTPDGFEESLREFERRRNEAQRARESVYCETSPVYAEGILVEALGSGYLLTSDGSGAHRVDGEPAKWVDQGSQLRITGAFVEGGGCDWWPVEVVSVPPHGGTIQEGYLAEPGDTGLASELVFRKRPSITIGGVPQEKIPTP